MIIYNGKSSRDFGIIFESYPTINHAARRGEGFQIAGRNGTFYRDENVFDNYVQPYNIAIREKNRGASARCSDIAAWLMSSSGFLRLEDSFEPEVFRFARYAGPLNVEQIMGRYGRCTLEFECQPERWLKSGEDPIALDSSTVPPIYNPTLFDAKPLIELYGSGTIYLSVNDKDYLTVQGQGSSGPVVIDCAEGTITDGAGDNIAAAVSFLTMYNELPVFTPGENTVTLTNASGYRITPRWWTL